MAAVDPAEIYAPPVTLGDDVAGLERVGREARGAGQVVGGAVRQDDQRRVAPLQPRSDLADRAVAPGHRDDFKRLIQNVGEEVGLGRAGEWRVTRALEGRQQLQAVVVAAARRGVVDEKRLHPP